MEPASEHGVLGRLDVLARQPGAAWLLGALYAAAGLIAIHANIFLNNEGVYSWMFSGLTSESPIDMLFFLNARPPIAVMYLPATVLGLRPFLWAHMLFAACAIPLTASIARHLGHERPLLPALLLAISPLYFAAAAAGVQNTDGAVGLLFAAWLLTRERPAAAGVVLSLVVLARIEVAFFAVAFAAYMLLRGDRRFVVAFAVIPVVYVLLGALYHGDLLWAARYPSFPTTNATIEASARAGYGGDLKDLANTLLALTPVVGVTLWFRTRGIRTLESVLALSGIAFVLVIRVLPLTQIIYVDASPRYVLPALPFLCLAISRAVEGWGRDRRASLWCGAALLVLSALLAVPVLGNAGSRDVVLVGASAGALLLAACAGCLAAAAVAFVSMRGAIATLLATAAVVALPLLPTTHLYLGRQMKQLDDAIQWIAEQKLAPDAVVVTDLHLLRLWMDQYAPDMRADVRHYITPEMLYQAYFLSNPSTGQFDALHTKSHYFYAPWIFPEEIPTLPGAVVVVMRSDIHRNDFLSKPPFDKVEWEVRNDDWMAGRLLRDAPTAPPPPVPRP